LILATFHSPELLILDEPTSGLDPLMQEEFLALVAEERERGCTVLISSHELDEVERVCDRVGIVRAGRLIGLRPRRLRQRLAAGAALRRFRRYRHRLLTARQRRHRRGRRAAGDDVRDRPDRALDTDLSGIRYLSVFKYYGNAIEDGIDPLAFAGVTIAAAALAALGAWLFERRDLSG
jgi:ABC-type multidrug transport system ATPase subunit